MHPRGIFLDDRKKSSIVFRIVDGAGFKSLGQGHD
jgi:hypothetical protein